jgi:hydrogenase/urease accessory protein HupE
MKRWMGLVAFAVAVLSGGDGQAHEVRPAYLELRQLDGEKYTVLFKVPARGPDKRLALYVRFPEDCQFIVPARTSFTGTAFVERSTIRRDGGMADAEIRIEGLAETRTDALARIEHADGRTQVERLTPTSPAFRVQRAPDKTAITTSYIGLGVEHILLGIDHLLFVLGLLLIVRGRRLLVKTITAFTLAHSITLGAAVMGFVHVPQAPVEGVIALSILFLAAELSRRGKGERGLTERYPWVVAFVFGCLHGFSFAGALTEVGLPATDIPLALLMFNGGVEIGQLMFVAGCLALSRLARPVLGATASWPPKAAAYGIGSISAFWLVERVVGFL